MSGWPLNPGGPGPAPTPPNFTHAANRLDYVASHKEAELRLVLPTE